MWHLWTRVSSGLGSAEGMAGLEDLGGLFQPEGFYDSVVTKLHSWVTPVHKALPYRALRLALIGTGIHGRAWICKAQLRTCRAWAPSGSEQICIWNLAIPINVLHAPGKIFCNPDSKPFEILKSLLHKMRQTQTGLKSHVLPKQVMVIPLIPSQLDGLNL